jgi:5-methylcytosine-specific restriction endonuclease McrA
MEDLFKSEAWQKATSLQRSEFVAKVRSEVRTRKEEQAKQKQAEVQKKLISNVKLNKRQKRLAKIRKRKQEKNNKLQAPFASKIDVRSDAFLSSFEWRKLRMQALKMYGPKCMCCGATPATGSVMNVDHIKPRKLFPKLALEINNLQILCHECNHGKGNWDQTDWRK